MSDSELGVAAVIIRGKAKTWSLQVRGRQMNRRRGRPGVYNGKNNSDRRRPEVMSNTRVQPVSQVDNERFDPYMEPDIRPNLEDSQIWRKNR